MPHVFVTRRPVGGSDGNSVFSRDVCDLGRDAVRSSVQTGAHICDECVDLARRSVAAESELKSHHRCAAGVVRAWSRASLAVVLAKGIAPDLRRDPATHRAV